MNSRRGNWILTTLLALLGVILSPLPPAGATCNENTIAWTEIAQSCDLHRTASPRIAAAQTNVPAQAAEPVLFVNPGHTNQLFQRPPPASPFVKA